MNKNIIGIIGGMGPQASAEFYRMLIMQARVHYGAHENSDYPELLIDSVPVPDFLSDTKQMEKASLISEDRVKRLTMYGVSTITIACNTACILIKRLQKSTCVSIVSVVEEVVKEVEKDNRKILLLASPTSLQAGLYQSAFKQHGISYVVPTTKELKELECIIRGIIDNENKEPFTKNLADIADRYGEKDNIQGIVLGCTELPLVFPDHYRLPVYSSLSILADTLLKMYYHRKEDL